MCYSVLTKNRIASTIWVYILCIIVWIVKMFLCVLFVIFHFILSSKAHVFRGKITNWLVFSILHVRSWNVHFTLTERTLTLCVFVFAFFFFVFSILNFCHKIVATRSLASTMIFLKSLFANFVLKMAFLYNINTFTSSFPFFRVARDHLRVTTWDF